MVHFCRVYFSLLFYFPIHLFMHYVHISFRRWDVGIFALRSFFLAFFFSYWIHTSTKILSFLKNSAEVSTLFIYEYVNILFMMVNLLNHSIGICLSPSPLLSLHSACVLSSNMAAFLVARLLGPQQLPAQGIRERPERPRGLPVTHLPSGSGAVCWSPWHARPHAGERRHHGKLSCYAGA